MPLHATFFVLRGSNSVQSLWRKTTIDTVLAICRFSQARMTPHSTQSQYAGMHRDLRMAQVLHPGASLRGVCHCSRPLRSGDANHQDARQRLLAPRLDSSSATGEAGVHARDRQSDTHSAFRHSLAADACVPHDVVRLFLVLLRLVRHRAVDASGPRRTSLTKDQIGWCIIGSVAITVFARLFIGWLCDRVGPRIAYTWLLLLGSLPVMGIGLAHDFATFLIFRVLIGAIGASFVITQYHTTLMFAPNCVGTANATTAGWGNLGGGVTQFVMPLRVRRVRRFMLGFQPRRSAGGPRWWWPAWSAP